MQYAGPPNYSAAIFYISDDIIISMKERMQFEQDPGLDNRFMKMDMPAIFAELGSLAEGDLEWATLEISNRVNDGESLDDEEEMTMRQFATNEGGNERIRAYSINALARNARNKFRTEKEDIAEINFSDLDKLLMGLVNNDDVPLAVKKASLQAYLEAGRMSPEFVRYVDSHGSGGLQGLMSKAFADARETSLRKYVDQVSDTLFQRTHGRYGKEMRWEKAQGK